METIHWLVSQMVSPVKIMDHLKSALQTIDPEFSAIECQFQFTVSHLSEINGLWNGVKSCVDELISTEILFFFWSGFLFNFECCQMPTLSLLLREDFDRFLREDRMMKIPIIQMKNDNFSTYMQFLSSEQQKSMEIITGYHAYMQTVGYKIAHYIGYRVADMFGEYIIPGYCSDSISSLFYKNKLAEYLQLPIHKLD